jgi:hypothetical protein
MDSDNVGDSSGAIGFLSGLSLFGFFALTPMKPVAV